MQSSDMPANMAWLLEVTKDVSVTQQQLDVQLDNFFSHGTPSAKIIPFPVGGKRS